MVKRAILFSAILSIISLLLVAYIPSEIFIRDPGQVRSPYDKELDEIRKKTEKGLPPSDPIWVKRDKLIKKSQDWYKNYREELIKNSATSAIVAWKKKSAHLSPVIMVLWGVSFYWFFRRRMTPQALWVLTFPVILTMAQLMPLLELALIGFVVIAIWFWLTFYPPKSNPPRESPT